MTSTASVAIASAAAWETAQTLKFPGLQVDISRPRLLARSRNYLWFPTLGTRPDGAIVALGQQYADVTAWPVPQAAFLSRDNGLTWSDAGIIPYIAESFVALPTRETFLLPYYILQNADHQSGVGYRMGDGPTAVQQLERPIRITGWPIPTFCIPKPPTASDGERRITAVFTGQPVATRHGTVLASIYCVSSLSPRRYALAIAESKDGYDWAILSMVAMEGLGYTANEGANEATLCRVPDGRLLCIYRAGGWHPNYAFGHSWSSDEGKTWTIGTPMAPGGSFTPMSVQPSAITTSDGLLWLSAGRPGLRLWIDPAGKAESWFHIDMQLHHTWCRPDEPILSIDYPLPKQSSSYTEMLPLFDGSVLLVYDRTPFGWDPIPSDSAETNSLWVVRIKAQKQS